MHEFLPKEGITRECEGNKWIGNPQYVQECFNQPKTVRPIEVGVCGRKVCHEVSVGGVFRDVHILGSRDSWAIVVLVSDEDSGSGSGRILSIVYCDRQTESASLFRIFVIQPLKSTKFQ